MRPTAYLVCLGPEDSEVIDAIRAEWPNDRYELGPTQILVVRSNGGDSIYDRIQKRLGRDFRAFIVRARRYHGRHNSELWEWLQELA